MTRHVREPFWNSCAGGVAGGAEPRNVAGGPASSRCSTIKGTMSRAPANRRSGGTQRARLRTGAVRGLHTRGRTAKSEAFFDASRGMYGFTTVSEMGWVGGGGAFDGHDPLAGAGRVVRGITAGSADPLILSWWRCCSRAPSAVRSMPSCEPRPQVAHGAYGRSRSKVPRDRHARRGVQ